MHSAFSTILTTVALNILKKEGVHISTAFSPINLIGNLASSSNCENNDTEFIPGSSLNRSQLLRQAQEFGSFHTHNWYLYARYYLTEKRAKEFELGGNQVKTLNFLMMNREKNLDLSCRGRGARIAKDDIFHVLEIPLFKRHISFVAFLPKKHISLSESLQKLDTPRFQRLLDNLAHGFVHFEVPIFKLSSRHLIYERLESSPREHITFHFDISENSGKAKTSSFVKAPCETIPYLFKLNRPFMFSILNGSVPITIGIFNGL